MNASTCNTIIEKQLTRISTIQKSTFVQLHLKTLCAEARKELDLGEPEAKIDVDVETLVENVEEDRTIMVTTGGTEKDDNAIRTRLSRPILLVMIKCHNIICVAKSGLCFDLFMTCWLCERRGRRKSASVKPPTPFMKILGPMLLNFLRNLTQFQDPFW
uniref:Uncharacterized protein n=1 Tax=Glossina austeni TaxID=7395 RepID=A0A1A9VH89_GLOAU